MPNPRQRTIELATAVIRAQGTIFIRELLRKMRRAGHPVRIGVNKTKVLENAIEAINGGWLSLEEIQEWLREVEGWGRQHIYLYTLHADAANQPRWRSDPAFQRYAQDQGIAFPSNNPFSFPPSFRLAHLGFDGTQFEARWSRGASAWRRESARDYRDTIDGDEYKFEAHRREPRRALMRFIIRPAEGLGALFVQIPLGREHDEAVSTAHVLIQRFVQTSHLHLLSISEAVKACDAVDLESDVGRLGTNRGRIQAQNTRFGAGGAAVQFSAEIEVGTYNAVAAVRRVRRALRPSQFAGEHARFNLLLESGTGLNRTVKMSMDGQNDRIYMHAQMNAVEVWSVLNLVFGLTR